MPASDSTIDAARSEVASPKGFFGRLRFRLQHMGFLGKALFVLIVAVIGGLLWRIRGGFLPTGSTILARLIGTLPLALMGLFFFGPGGLAIGAALFVTLSTNGFGKLAGASNLGQIAKLTGWGGYLTVIPGLIGMFFGAGGWWFTAAGLLMGVVYGGARMLFPKATLFPAPKLGGFIRGNTELAEVLMGMVIYGSFAIDALNADSTPRQKSGAKA